MPRALLINFHSQESLTPCLKRIAIEYRYGRLPQLLIFGAEVLAMRPGWEDPRYVAAVPADAGRPPYRARIDGLDFLSQVKQHMPSSIVSLSFQVNCTRPAEMLSTVSSAALDSMLASAQEVAVLSHAADKPVTHRSPLADIEVILQKIMPTIVQVRRPDGPRLEQLFLLT